MKSKKHAKARKFLQRCSQGAPKGSKMLPKRAQDLQEGPKDTQKPPQESPRASKVDPRRPKKPPKVSPKESQIGQETSKKALLEDVTEKLKKSTPILTILGPQNHRLRRLCSGFSRLFI